MKKVIIITLLITVAAVIKRVADLDKRIRFAEEQINTLTRIIRI